MRWRWVAVGILQLLLPPMTKYQRRTAHNIARLDQLGHVVDAAERVVFIKHVGVSRPSGCLEALIEEAHAAEKAGQVGSPQSPGHGPDAPAPCRPRFFGHARVPA
jgi:hypothetical protein